MIIRLETIVPATSTTIAFGDRVARSNGRALPAHRGWLECVCSAKPPAFSDLARQVAVHLRIAGVSS
jgi:hypothetical protein